MIVNTIYRSRLDVQKTNWKKGGAKHLKNRPIILTAFSESSNRAVSLPLTKSQEIRLIKGLESLIN